MDVAFFLCERTRFIGYFFDQACKPFALIKSNIEGELPPYEPPAFNPDYDSGEPPHLEEWLEADTGIKMLGISAISMLSDTIKIYFSTLRDELGFAFSKEEEKRMKKEGFVAIHKEALGEVLSTDWSDCPVDFAIIEQVVLARNRGQHGEHLPMLPPTHDAKTLEKHPRPFFISEHEKRQLELISDGSSGPFFIDLEITRETLFEAIKQIETLAVWIQEREERAANWRRRMREKSSET